MKIGDLKQRANWFLVGFVFGCIFIIILLLFITVKAEAKAENLNSVAIFYKYNPE